MNQQISSEGITSQDTVTPSNSYRLLPNSEGLDSPHRIKGWEKGDPVRNLTKLHYETDKTGKSPLTVEGKGGRILG